MQHHVFAHNHTLDDAVDARVEDAQVVAISTGLGVCGGTGINIGIEDRDALRSGGWGG